MRVLVLGMGRTGTTCEFETVARLGSSSVQSLTDILHDISPEASIETARWVNITAVIYSYILIDLYYRRI